MGRGEVRGVSCPRAGSVGLSFIVLKFVCLFNGRHKFAHGRPDFFALLSCLPCTIHAVDTVYEPNAVISRFLGSISMAFFSLFLCLFLVVSSILAFLVYSIFPFFPLFSIAFPFIFFLVIFFMLFIPIGLRLTWVWVVICTTCNIYVVVFFRWQVV